MPNQSERKSRRIGIFSGSFNPIHTGHAIMANYVAQFGGIDELWLMVSRVNPWKTDAPPIADMHRANMCRIVAENCRNVAVSEFELGLPTPSYTFNTLAQLRAAFPDYEFVLIIGSDNWIAFREWKNYEEILDNHSIIVYPRPGFITDSAKLPSNVKIIYDAPQSLISSTFVREHIGKNDNLNYMVPVDVVKYIKENHLYGK
ncbi:MAG: nicotinate (nicotinamide) nucleotide adenylyltransferase [Candidatus Amulumruptor caecigallinarius]|nr:nicotinate (nicotinamide) nucleotide adenylyltransferase [Candidatus Amulumruptor caecigallinarius]